MSVDQDDDKVIWQLKYAYTNVLEKMKLQKQESRYEGQAKDQGHIKIKDKLTCVQ